jgi:hypothetical protein
MTYASAQALATLEACVKQRWKVLPPDQREAIKSYIVNVIVRCGSTCVPERLLKELRTCRISALCAFRNMLLSLTLYGLALYRALDKERSSWQSQLTRDAWIAGTLATKRRFTGPRPSSAN